MPPLFHSEAISFVRRTNFIKKTTCRNKSLFLVGDDGFEPSKLKATDLQSAPFGHSGTLPYRIVIKSSEIVELAMGLEPATC